MVCWSVRSEKTPKMAMLPQKCECCLPRLLKCHFLIIANDEPLFSQLFDGRWKVYDLAPDENGTSDIYQRVNITEPVQDDKSNDTKTPIFDQAAHCWQSKETFPTLFVQIKLQSRDEVAYELRNCPPSSQHYPSSHLFASRQSFANLPNKD